MYLPNANCLRPSSLAQDNVSFVESIGLESPPYVRTDASEPGDWLTSERLSYKSGFRTLRVRHTLAS